MSRPSQDSYFMQIAILAAERSPCRSRKVGCVIVDASNRILSTGYNGPPRGFPHCNVCARKSSASGEDLHKCYAIHAEQNALLYCHDIDKIHKIYVTSSPCLSCTLMLLNTPCHYIICDEIYSMQTMDLWKERGRDFKVFQ